MCEPGAVRLLSGGQRFFYSPTPVDGKRGTDFKSVPLCFPGRMKEIYGSAPADRQGQAQAVAGLHLSAFA